jgi:hypothetical protein
MQAGANKDVQALLQKELKGRAIAHRRGHTAERKVIVTIKKIYQSSGEREKENITF